MADAASYVGEMTSAEARYADGAYKDAATHFQQAADLATGREKAIAYTRLGDCLGALNAPVAEREAAFRQAADAIETRPPPPPDAFVGRLYNAFGVAQGAQGRTADAVGAYDKAVAYYPPDNTGRAYPLNNWADILFNQGDSRGAMEKYEAAAKSKPDFIDPINSVGRCWLLLNEPDKALRQFDAAADRWAKDPPQPESQAIALNNGALALKRLWRLGDAKARCDDAIKAVEPPRFADLALVADILVNQESEVAAAAGQQAEDKAGARAPNLQARIDNLARWADAVRNAEDYVAAEGLYRHALDLAPQDGAPEDPAAALSLDSAKIGLVWALAGQERFADAIDAYPEAKLDNAQPYALRTLGDQQLVRDDLEAAEQTYRLALKLDPNEPPGDADDLSRAWDGAWTYFGLANVLTARGAFGDAIATLQEGLRKAERRLTRLRAAPQGGKGDYEADVRGVVFMRHNLAYAFRNSGQYAAAQREFDQVAADYENYISTYDPDVSSDVYFFYAGIRFEVFQDLKRAEELYRLAIRKGRGNLRVHLGLAKLYRRQAALVGDLPTARADKPGPTRMDFQGRLAQARRDARAAIDAAGIDPPAGPPNAPGLPEYSLRLAAADMALLCDDDGGAEDHLTKAGQYLNNQSGQLGLAISRRAEIDARLAKIAVRREQYGEAAIKLRAAIANTPANLGLTADLGAALYAGKNKPDAEREYRKLLALAPGNVDALMGLAHICLDLGDDGATQRYREAERYLDQILQGPPDGGLSRRLRDRELAGVYYLRGYARSKSPDGGGVALRLGRANNYRRARDDFRAAIARDPQNFKAVDACNSLNDYLKDAQGGDAIGFLSSVMVVLLGFFVFVLAQYLLVANLWAVKPPHGPPPARLIDFVSYISLSFGAIMVVVAGFFLPYITSLKAGPVELQKAGGPTSGAGLSSLEISRPDSAFSGPGSGGASPGGG